MEASLTGQPGNPERGRQIVENRQLSACLLCHSGPFPEPHLQGTVGPSLDGVGSRLSTGRNPAAPRRSREAEPGYRDAVL